MMRWLIKKTWKINWIELFVFLNDSATGIEAVGQKHRVLCGFIYNIITSVGSVLLGVAAYYVRDWRTLQFITGAPIFLFLFIPMWDIFAGFRPISHPADWWQFEWIGFCRNQPAGWSANVATPRLKLLLIKQRRWKTNPCQLIWSLLKKRKACL